jgi:acyl carrier protein
MNLDRPHRRNNPRERVVRPTDRVVTAGYLTTGVYSAARWPVGSAKKNWPTCRSRASQGGPVPAIPETDTQERLRMIIAEIIEMDLTENEVDSSFSEDLAVSSLEKVAIVSKVEKEFSVTLTDSEAASMTSLRSAVELLSGKGVR